MPGKGLLWRALKCLGYFCAVNSRFPKASACENISGTLQVGCIQTWQWHDNDMTQFRLRRFEKDGNKMGTSGIWVRCLAHLGTHVAWPRLQPGIYALQDTADTGPTGPLPPERDVALALKAAPTARGPRKAWSPVPKWTEGGSEWPVLRESDTFGDIWRYLEIFGDIWRPGRSGTECWVLGVLSRFFGGSQRSILCASLCHDSWVL